MRSFDIYETSVRRPGLYWSSRLRWDLNLFFIGVRVSKKYSMGYEISPEGRKVKMSKGGYASQLTSLEITVCLIPTLAIQLRWSWG